jgi:HK97 family phage major capsid protein
MSKTLLRKLQENRLTAVKAARDIAERAAAGEELSGADKVAYSKANLQIDRFGELIADETRRTAEERAWSDNIGAAYGEAGITAGRGNQSHSEFADLWREVASGQSSQRTFTEHIDKRALAIATATKGPETVPVTLLDTLLTKLFDDSAVLSLPNLAIKVTQSGEDLKLPRLATLGALTVTAPGAGSARVAEAGAIQFSDMTFDQITLQAFKYAHAVLMSRELNEDSVLNMESEVGAVLGRNIANYIGFDLTSGAGTTGIPRGVRTIAALNKVDTAAGGLWGTLNVPADFNKFYDVTAKLQPGYRKNAVWLVNPASIVNLLKAVMNNQYVWQPSQQLGAPDTFLGYGIYTDPNIPVPAASAGVNAVFLDPSAYAVRIVRGVEVDVSREFAWANDQVAIKATLRADGDAYDDLAVAGYSSTA